MRICGGGRQEEEFNTGWGWSSWGVSMPYRQHAPLGLVHGVVSEHHLKERANILETNLIMHPVEDLGRHHMDTGARSIILLSRVKTQGVWDCALLIWKIMLVESL